MYALLLTRDGCGPNHVTSGSLLTLEQIYCRLFRTHSWVSVMKHLSYVAQENRAKQYIARAYRPLIVFFLVMLESS